ncbi:DUF4185 domain-containing protein [Nocardioides sp. zg-DK7169]|uniref:DUF4185 domain-containing protein n=1 Tax=Nocardioides sp. zg-DK7169 TaxID=2736600 RepID=UPI001554832C|nr:DUF4185 domain-containing protein [Nocardioides sp. zg-DK7169]NPC98714.1 DUF4185 domain-containing protein [Nocardioides sp. zg-DK7169]
MSLATWRLRVFAVVLPILALSLGAVLLVPDVDADLATPPVRGASETECLRTERPRTVAQLNEFVEEVRGGGEFAGADVGASTVLQDGRRLWVFADTLRSADFEGQRFVRNSMLAFDRRCVQVVLPADHGALIPDRPDGVGYWPMSVVTAHRTGYDLVTVFSQRVRSTDEPDGVFAFETLGPAVAVFVVERGRTPQLLAVRDLGADDPDTTRPMWGAAAAVSRGWLHLYGTSRPDTEGIFGYDLRVARVRPDDVLEQARWEYWDGTRWQPDAGAAQVLIEHRGGVSQTLSVFEQAGRWYALSKRDEVLGTDVAVWSSARPEGPFSAPVTVASLPSDPDSGLLRYMPLAHPDLLPRPGSVVVSYSRNYADPSVVWDEPFRYRPAFLRVQIG